MARLIPAFEQFFDSKGKVLKNGLIDFFESGSSSLRKTTFADSSEKIANSNPVILNGDGRCPNVFGSGTYRAALTDSDGNQFVQRDPVGGDQNLAFGADWDSTQIYAANDVVRDAGSYWASATNNNLNNKPSTDDGTNWFEVIDGIPGDFDSVAGMKSSNSLVPGMSISTLGYYAAGDGGHGQYLVSSPASVDGFGDHLAANGNALLLQQEVSRRKARQYGVAADDATDDGPSFNAALASLPSTGGSVEFEGLCSTEEVLTVKSVGVTIRGSGVKCAQLRIRHNLGAGILVEHATSPGSTAISTFQLKDMAIRAMTETTHGACLELNKVNMFFGSNISMEDHYGGILTKGGLKHFITNLHVSSPRAAFWSGVKAGSNFLKYEGSADGAHPVAIMVSNMNVRRQDTLGYIDNGIVVKTVDGLWITNGHSMGVANATVDISPGVDDTVTGVKFNNFWFDNNSARGLNITGNPTGQFGTIDLGDCNFLTNTDQAIFVDAGSTGFQGVRMTGGHIHKAGGNGALLRAGVKNSFVGVEFSACNTLGGGTGGGINVAGAANAVVSACTFNEEQGGVTSTSMKGVLVAPGATGRVIATGNDFDLTDTDILDQGASDNNRYPSNITGKLTNNVITTVSGTVLDVPELGTLFNVAGGLNFNNASGRWHEHAITLMFAGASTVTHVAGGIRLNGSVNFVAKAGDTLSLIYERQNNDWIETGRMVS